MVYMFSKDRDFFRGVCYLTYLSDSRLKDCSYYEILCKPLLKNRNMCTVIFNTIDKEEWLGEIMQVVCNIPSYKKRSQEITIGVSS